MFAVYKYWFVSREKESPLFAYIEYVRLILGTPNCSNILDELASDSCCLTGNAYLQSPLK